MKKRLVKKHSAKSGLPPGSLIHIGKDSGEVSAVSVISYDSEKFTHQKDVDISRCAPFAAENAVMWVNIDGLSRTEIIARAGEIFDIHPLTLEDILNTDQRPKVETFDNYIFVVLKMLTFSETAQTADSEQVSLVMGKNFVVSFQERKGDVFGTVRQRIETAKGKIRNADADYLLYCLIDAVVDNYFLVLEKIGELVEALEEELIENPTQETFRKIHSVKRELILLRKSVWPLREVVANLKRSDSPLVAESTGIYFADVYDHTIQIIDTVESLRDITAGMIEMYLSSLSNRMNAVMKVLAVIATVFMPLSFLAGIYGMNFDHFPELHYRWMYPWGFWGIIAVAVMIMLYLFRRKKWL